MFKLNNYLKKSNNEEGLCLLFEILDEKSNRWLNIENLNTPVIIDESIKDEIKKTFEVKESLRATRFLSYLINKNVRNLRKRFNNYFSDSESKDPIDTGTYWGKFTHTAQSKLKKDKEYNALWQNDFEIGLKNIKIKLKEISDTLKPYNTEFYIVIHPWRETLEFGQAEFNWEKFNEGCFLAECKKVISIFVDVKKIKNSNPFWKTEIYFPRDVHFNKKGNNLYSDRIYIEAFR